MSVNRFRLSTLLRLREQARDERRAQFAEANEALHRLEEHLAEADRELTTLRNEYGDATRPGAVLIDRLLAAQRYEVVLIAQRKTVEQQHVVISQEVERRRLVLAEAERDVKSLEKLRDRQTEKFKHEQQVADQKRLDEVALTRHREVAQ